MGVTRPKMLNERKPSLADKVLSAVLTAVLVLLVAFTIFNLWFVQNYFVVQVDGISMNDTLADKDLLYTQKRNFEAQRGDIVIIDVEPYRGLFSRNVEHIIKRLIAVEGDCVKCEQGTVYVKAGEGEYAPLSEPYAKGVTEDFHEFQVGKGEIFFLGDNREDSKDSRMVGCLEYRDIIGVVPEWAVRIKNFTTQWERQRGALVGSNG